MTTLYEPVRLARLAWQRTQPQLFIDFEELPDATTTVARPPLAGRCQAVGPGTTPLAVPDVQPQREGRPGPTTPNETGGGRTSYPGRAPASRQDGF